MADNLPVPSGSDGQLVVTVDSRQAIAGLSAIEVQFIKMTNTVNNGVSQMAPAFNRFQNFIKNAIVGISSYFVLKDVFRILKAGFDGLVSAAQAFVSRMIEVNRVYTGFIASMSIIKGSVRAAADEYKFLLDISNRLGVEVESSITQYHRLAAALKNVDTTGELTRHIFSGISQAAVVLHSRGRDVTLIFEAVQQMASKGKLSLEELQRQLGNTLPGAVGMAARSMMESQAYVEKGIKTASQAEQMLREQIKKGTINVYEFLLRFSNQLKKEYGAGVAYAADQFTANFNRMKNTIFEFYRIVGSSDAMSGLTKLIREVTALFNDSAAQGAYGMGQALGQVFSDLANWVSKLDSTDVKEFFEAINAAVSSTFIVVEAFFDIFRGFGDSTMRTPILDFVEFVAKTMAALVDIMRVAAAGIESSIRLAVSGFNWVKTPAMAIGNWTGRVSDESRASFQASRDNNDNQFINSLGMFLAGPGEGKMAFDQVSAQFDGARQQVAGEKYGVQPWALKPLDFSAQPKDTSVPKSYIFGANHPAPDWITNGASYSRRKAGSTADAAARYVNPLGNSELQQLLEKIQANSGAPNSGKGKSGSDAEAGGAERAREKTLRDYERMEDRVGRWRGEVGITEKAEDKLRRAEEDLTEAVGKRDPVTGKILLTETQHQDIMEKLRERYEEALDPIGFVLRAYDKETISLKYVGDAAQEYSEILKQQEKWRQNKVKYTDKDIEQLRKKIRLQNEANRMQSAMNGVLNDTKYKQRGELDTIHATGNLLKGYKNPDGSTEQITKGQASMKVVDIFGEDNLSGTEEYYEAQFQIYTDFLARVDEAKKERLVSEQTAEKLQRDAWWDLQQDKLDRIAQVNELGNIMMQSNNKKIFKAGKALALSSAVITGISSAMKSYDNGGGYPWGLIPMALSIATTAVQISKIRSQEMPGYATGGSYVVGGTGGVDSQLVQFHATPGERISINTPSQASAMQDTAKMLRANQGRRGNVTMNLTVIQQGRADNTTPEQNARAMRKQAEKMEW